MDPLDKSMDFIDPAGVSPQQTAMRYGIFWGLGGIILGLLAHLMGWTDPSAGFTAGSAINSILGIVLAVAMVVLAIRTHRDNELGGYISFGRGFKTGMITTLFYAIIAAIWTYIFVTFIAADMMDGIQEAMVEQWEEQGLSDAEIEQAQQFTGFMGNPVWMVAMAFFGGLIWGAIISLIVSAVMKKESPQHA